MSIEEIRQRIANGELQIPVNSTEVCQGQVVDAVGTSHQYRIELGANPQLATQCDTEWTEFFSDILNHLATLEPEQRIQAAQGLQLGGKHWDWFAKTLHYKSGSYAWFFILINNQVQGICLISHPTGAKLEPGEIFYVEYLSTAPWNTQNPLAPKRYSGIGTLMLQHIIEYSVSTLGLKLGFNLHAIRQAEGFYKKIGMQHLPEHDKTENSGSVLKFFEITEKATQALVAT